MSGGLFSQEGIDSTVVPVFAFHLLRNTSWFSETPLLPVTSWRLPLSTWLLLAAPLHFRHCQMLGLRGVPSPRTSPSCDSQDQAIRPPSSLHLFFQEAWGLGCKQAIWMTYSDIIEKQLKLPPSFSFPFNKWIWKKRKSSHFGAPPKPKERGLGIGSWQICQELILPFRKISKAVIIWDYGSGNWGSEKSSELPKVEGQQGAEGERVACFQSSSLQSP